MKNMKLYILTKLPPNKVIRENLINIFKEKRKINVLCFGSFSKHKEINFRNCFPDFEFDFKIFSASEDKDKLISYLNECNTYYFNNYGALKEYKRFLSKNNLDEALNFFIGTRKFAPAEIVLKRNNSYYKLLTIDRGDDQSIYFNFNGDYLASEHYSSKGFYETQTLTLKKIEEKIYSPYISYHPNSGLVHSKDKDGNFFIPDLKVDSLSRIVKNTLLFPFLSMIVHLDLKKIKSIGPPPLERSFNFIEIGENPPNIIKKGYSNTTFIIVDLGVVGQGKDLYMDFWFHKNLANGDILNSLNDWQKSDMYNNLTMSNKLSDISYTILFKTTEAKEDNFNGVLIVLFTKEKQYICTLRKM